MKQSHLNRRAFLKLSAASLATSASGLVAQVAPANTKQNRLPLRASDWQVRNAKTEITYAGLVSSLKTEHHYTCEVRGELPADLQGTLYRTGPGLLERGGHRRRMIVDADGMMRKFEFTNGEVKFSNRHIRTEKFNAEEKAGRYLYPSFGMLAPDSSFLANSLTNIKNQASVAAFMFGGRLFATDEVQTITELDPESLATLNRPSPFGEDEYKAHVRITNFGKKTLHLAKYNVMNSSLQFVTYNENFKQIAHSKPVKVDRVFHDWHVTPNYYVILLPPTFMNKWGIMKAMAGQATIGDSIQFDRSKTAQVLVVPRDGRNAVAFNLTDVLDSWHSVNAYENSDGQIVFDFVATETLVSPVASEAPMCKIMSGTLTCNNSLRPTVVSRAVVDYNRNKATYSPNCFGLRGIEMPTLNPQLAGLAHDNSYFVAGQEGLDSQLVRLDNQRATIDSYNFGAGQFVTEPIYATSKNNPNRGYLLSEVYNHVDRKSSLTIFDGENLARGPIGEVLLKHHLPLGFHGFWE